MTEGEVIMKGQTEQKARPSSLRWIALAGVATTAALGVAWIKRRARGRSGEGAVGKHAWLVPTQLARREARWTRQALVHSSEAHKS